MGIEPTEKKAICPIQRIPLEIIREIFLQCLSDDLYSKVASSEVPLLVSQICAGWRSLALSIPELWSSIAIIVSSRGSTQIPIIELWLSRSGILPLDISLTLDQFPPVPNALVTRAALAISVLARKMSHWRDVRFVLPGSHTLLRGIFSDTAPQLDKLTLDLRDWKYDDTGDLNLALRRSTSSLRRFSWSNRCSWGSWDTNSADILSNLQVPLFQLTHIVFDTWLCLEDTLHILRQCESVVECDLRHFGGGSRSEELGSPTFCLPHLQSLRIYQLNLNEGLGILMDSLVCPKLREFSVTCGFIDRVSWPQKQFTAFLERSSCLLEILWLEYSGISEDDVIELLRLTSASLVQLHILGTRGSIYVSNNLISALAVTNHPQPMCSKLEVLNLKIPLMTVDGVLADMVAGRWWGGNCTRLRRIGVTPLGSQYKIDKERLKVMQGDGLIVGGI